MQDILTVFTDNILPIMLVASFGFALRRLTEIDKQAISRLTFYVFSPALLFSSLTNSTIPTGDLLRMAGVASVTVVLAGAVAFGFGRIFHLPRQQIIVLVLAAMFGNVGNFGLSLNELRYGDTGLAHAIPYFVVEGILVWTVGVIIVSLGRQSWQAASKGLLKLPALYAIIAALIISTTSLSLPRALQASIDIAGRGAVPVMLIILGMQMADVRALDSLKLAIPAIGVRLLVAPLIALILIPLFQLNGLAYSVSLLQSAVPIAVATIVLTTEYDVLPKAMTTAVVLSTLLSPLTIVALIQLLGL